jgi:hypothetical protein
VKGRGGGLAAPRPPRGGGGQGPHGPTFGLVANVMGMRFLLMGCTPVVPEAYPWYSLWAAIKVFAAAALAAGVPAKGCHAVSAVWGRPVTGRLAPAAAGGACAASALL